MKNSATVFFQIMIGYDVCGGCMGGLVARQRNIPYHKAGFFLT
jgi:hypothetical protein